LKPRSSLAIGPSTDRYQLVAEIQKNDIKFLKTDVPTIILPDNYSLHCWIHIEPHSRSQNLGSLMQCWPYYNMPLHLQSTVRTNIVVFCCLDTVPAHLDQAEAPTIEATVRRDSVP